MKYDILSITEKSVKLKVDAGKYNSLAHSEIKKSSVRRFKDGQMFQASSVGNLTNEELLSRSSEWASVGIPHEYGFANAHSEKRAGPKSPSHTLEAFKECLDLVNSQFSDRVIRGAYQHSKHTQSLSSNYGVDLEATGESVQWYLFYQIKGSGNLIDGWIDGDGVNPPIMEELKQKLPFLKADAKQMDLKAGRYPVLMTDALSPIEKLTDSFKVHDYSEGASLYSNKLGQALFDPRITIVDRSYDPEHGQFIFFDGEGSVRESPDLVLVKNGVFADLISDLRFGRKYNRKSTANGIRGWNGGVSLSPHSLLFKAGQKSWKDLIKDHETVIIATVAAGGDSNDLGEYSSPVQIGYIAHRGEIVGKAPQLTVKTSVEKYLGKDLIDVSSDCFQGYRPGGLPLSFMDVFVN